MKTKLTDHYIPAIMNVFANTVERGREWQPSTRFIEGVSVRNNGRLYLAGTTGFSGTAGPSHTSGKAIDGTVSWYYVRDIAATDSLGGNLFLGVGDPGTWKAEPVADDLGAVDSVDQAKCIESLSVLLRLTASDVSLGIPRRTWASAVIPEWPAVDSYAIVGQSVYRCISNNAGAVSTVSPTGVSLSPFEVADGYVWKFLGAIPISQDQKFSSTAAFPVSSLTVDDGSDRWTVQSVAKAGSLSGFDSIQQVGDFTTPVTSVIGDGTGAVARADLTVTGTIRRVVATAGGQDYKQRSPAVAIIRETGVTSTTPAAASAVIDAGLIDEVIVNAQGTGYPDAVAFVVGDGTGATVDVVVTSGFVTAINVVTPGTGYTYADVVIIPGDSGAVAVATMAPIGGHGRDMTKELPVEYIMVSKRINSIEGTNIPEAAIRQFSLITGVTTSGDVLIGPDNADHVQTANLDTARALVIQNINTVVHADTQYEEFSLALRLVK